MKEISLDEMRRLQIDILDQFATYCDGNHLKYSLTGGTLIGAVRHKGFIPWDDDIDVAMPRADYERFLSSFNVEGYRIITPHNNEKYVYPFAKLVNSKTRIIEHADTDSDLGIYIDIFPIDCIPRKSITSYYRKRKILEFVMSCKMAERKKSRMVIKQAVMLLFRKLFARIGLNNLGKKIDKMSSQYDSSTSEMAGNIVWGYGPREIVKKEFFEAYTLLDFEGKKYSALQEYHEFLTAIYGDYMQLPPADQRVLKHDVQAYWLCE